MSGSVGKPFLSVVIPTMGRDILVRTGPSLGLLGTLITSLLVPSCWSNVVPSLTQTSIILSLGVYGCIGHFMIIRAFSETPASILSPLLYSQLVWATLLGWQIFGQFPDLLTLLGMLIIGGSSLSLALKQARAIA